MRTNVTRLIILPALLGLAVPAGPAWAGDATSRSGSQDVPDDQDTQTIRQKMGTLQVDLDFVDATLEDMLVFTRDFSKLTIVLDAAVREDAAAMNRKVDFKTKGLPLGLTMKLYLERFGLACSVRDKAIVIHRPPPAPAGAARFPFDAETPVGDPKVKEALDRLVKTRMSVEFQNQPLREVVEFLRQFTNTNIVFTGDVETGARITLSLRDARFRTALLLMLSTQDLTYGMVNEGVLVIAPAARSGPRPVPSPRVLPPNDPEGKAARDKLADLRMDIDFRDAGLEDILCFIGTFANLNFAIDQAVRSDLAIMDRKVSVKGVGLVLSDAVRQVLDRFGIDHMLVDEGVILLVTPEKAVRARLGAGDAPPEAVVAKLARTKVDLDFTGARLDTVLASLRESAGIDILIEAAADRKAPVTVREAGVPLYRALDLVLPPVLTYTVKGGTLVVGPRAPR